MHWRRKQTMRTYIRCKACGKGGYRSLEAVTPFWSFTIAIKAVAESGNDVVVSVMAWQPRELFLRGILCQLFEYAGGPDASLLDPRMP